MVSYSTIEGLGPTTRSDLASRRRLYAVTTALISLVVAVAALDGIGLIDAVGVDSRRTTVEGGGYRLTVQYGEVSRPALATPFEIVVTRPGGFVGPVTLAVDRSYLKMWDENGLVPEPSSVRADEDRVIWEFEPPDGDELAIYFDARIEPAVQRGRDGWVAIIEEDQEVARIDFHTRVLP